MVVLRYYISQNVGRKGLPSEVQVVCMGQNSKPAHTIIIPDVDVNNQPVPQTTVGANTNNLSLNGVVIGL